MAMPKTLSNKRAYDSDDGFVEGGAPKSKKARSEQKPLNKDTQRDNDGNAYWELTGKRRVQISKFNNNTMIGIREFYEKDGQMLPGKKGISMTLEQYTSFIELMPAIESELKSQGHTVPRPQYDKKDGPKAIEDGDASEAESSDAADSEGVKTSSKHRGRLEKFKHKKNHEATSSSDEA